MSVGDFAGGFTQAISNYLTGERDRARKAEDEELEYRRSMIQSLISRPDFNPAHLGKALHDLVEIGQAKTGQRKMKKGAAGFQGHSELPLSQFFSGVMSGATPIFDPPAPVAPTPVEWQLPAGPSKAELLGPHPTTGEAALNEPIIVPPKGSFVPDEAKGMHSAALQMREQQMRSNPAILKSPEQMAQERGAVEGITYGARRKGQQQADVDILLGLGATEDQIREAMLREMMGTSNAANNFQEYVYMTPDGKRFSARVNLRTNETFDLNGMPFQLPMGAVRIGVGAPNQVNFFQDDQGRVSGVATNRYEPQTGANQIPVAPNVQGRTSPEGPVVPYTGLNGEPAIGRAPRQGTTIRPMDVQLGPQVPLPPQPVAGPASTQPATMPAEQPPTAEMRNLPQRLAGIKTAVNELRKKSLGIKGVSDGINDNDGIGQLGEGLFRRAKSYINLDDEVKNYMDLKQAFAGQLSRLSGEVGVLTDQDVSRALNWVPNPWDSRTSAEEKLRLLDQFLADKLSMLPGRANRPNQQRQPAGTGGTLIQAPDGSTKEYTDPAMIQFLISRGAKVVQ